MPAFDVLLLGVGGEDAHVASLFPEHPALYETERTVVAVRGCAQAAADADLADDARDPRGPVEVWLLAAGADKAAAVALALSGAGEVAVPAAGARGRRSTLWLLDRAAATKLPRDLAPPVA